MTGALRFLSAVLIAGVIAANAAGQGRETLPKTCDEAVDTLLADTAVFLYGTTRATNAIVERKIARTAFLTTEGFPDVLLLKEGGK